MQMLCLGSGRNAHSQAVDVDVDRARSQLAIPRAGITKTIQLHPLTLKLERPLARVLAAKGRFGAPPKVPGMHVPT